MNDVTQENTLDTIKLSDSVRAEIDKWLAKYPPDQRRSAVLAALRIVQDDQGGWLTEAAQNAVADYLQIPRIEVYEVSTFYTMFDLKPVGKHKIYVCTNISCMLCGCNKIVDHLKDKLGIGFGETTKDGRYTLYEVECMAACANAPMMQVDKTYYENLTPEKVDQVLSELE